MPNGQPQEQIVKCLFEQGSVYCPGKEEKITIPVQVMVDDPSLEDRSLYKKEEGVRDYKNKQESNLEMTEEQKRAIRNHRIWKKKEIARYKTALETGDTYIPKLEEYQGELHYYL